MGYTHYWYRQATIPQRKMTAIIADFNKIVLALADLGVQLGDAMGENVPEITDDCVAFNGYSKCGHKVNESIVIPWPTTNARGVAESAEPAGNWFAGATLDVRTCDGDCSYESFVFEREWDVPDYQRKNKEYKDGLYFVCCKTAFKPYDVAVTAFLIIAKHHLGAKIRVSSDGEDQHWQDAKRLCFQHLGYGPEFRMGEALEENQLDDAT